MKLKERAKLARELAMALDRAADLEAKLTAGAAAELEKPTPPPEPAPRPKPKPKPKPKRRKGRSKPDPKRPSPRRRSARELGDEDRALLERVVEQNGSMRAASSALGLPAPAVSQILRCERAMTPAIARTARELLERPPSAA